MKKLARKAIAMYCLFLHLRLFLLRQLPSFTVACFSIELSIITKKFLKEK